DKERPPFVVRRHNFTWIKIQFEMEVSFKKKKKKKFNLVPAHWRCVAQEIARSKDDNLRVHFKTYPLSTLTNLANNLTNTNSTGPRLDSVLVTCRYRHIWTNHHQTYTKVVPLVQHYHKQQPSAEQTNQ